MKTFLYRDLLPPDPRSSCRAPRLHGVREAIARADVKGLEGLGTGGEVTLVGKGAHGTPGAGAVSLIAVARIAVTLIAVTLIAGAMRYNRNGDIL